MQRMLFSRDGDKGYDYAACALFFRDEDNSVDYAAHALLRDEDKHDDYAVLALFEKGRKEFMQQMRTKAMICNACSF